MNDKVLQEFVLKEISIKGLMSWQEICTKVNEKFMIIENEKVSMEKLKHNLCLLIDDKSLLFAILAFCVDLN